MSRDFRSKVSGHFGPETFRPPRHSSPGSFRSGLFRQRVLSDLGYFGPYMFRPQNPFLLGFLGTWTFGSRIILLTVLFRSRDKSASDISSTYHFGLRHFGHRKFWPLNILFKAGFERGPYRPRNVSTTRHFGTALLEHATSRSRVISFRNLLVP